MPTRSIHVEMHHTTYTWVMPHTHESCPSRVSHVTYKWVMSHTNKSCHVQMRHVTQKWVMSRPLNAFTKACMWKWVISHIHESCHRYMSHVTCTCVMSRTNESCLLGLSHVTWHDSFLSDIEYRHEMCRYYNESCHVPLQWVMSRPYNESCHVP